MTATARKRRRVSHLFWMATALPFLAGGCDKGPSPQNPPAISNSEVHAASAPHHTHAGPHGGAVLSMSDFHIEITHAPAVQKLTLHVLGSDALTSKPIAAETISAQIKPEGSEIFETLAFAASPLDGENAAQASRFDSPRIELKTMFELDVKIRQGDLIFRAHALLDPAAIGPPEFICPMKCNEGKKYPNAGNCPVCGMALVQTRGGILEHSDHQSKHGGQFFMAGDNWHHLEGVFSPPDEFRLYLYDNFTHPITAAGYEADAEFASAENSAPIAEKFVLVSGGSYLLARIPAGAAQPVSLAVRIRLQAGHPPELFNFSAVK